MCGGKMIDCTEASTHEDYLFVWVTRSVQPEDNKEDFSFFLLIISDDEIFRIYYPEV